MEPLSVVDVEVPDWFWMSVELEVPEVPDWFFVPSVPLFIALPILLRSGLGFWASMAIVVAGTLALYALMFWAAPRIGIKL